MPTSYELLLFCKPLLLSSQSSTFSPLSTGINSCKTLTRNVFQFHILSCFRSLLTPHLLTIPPLLVLPLLLSEHTSVTATHQLHSLFPSSLQAHQNFQQKLLRDRNPGNTHRPLLSLLSLPHGVDTTVAMDLDCGLRHKDHPVMR